jgi:YVTN family beta-propeller protein
VPHPNAVEFNPTGTLAYITSGTTPGTVKVLDTTTYQIVKSYSVGNEPLDVIVNYTGKWVGVTNYSSDFLSFINTTDGNIINVQVGPNPRGLAWVR